MEDSFAEGKRREDDIEDNFSYRTIANRAVFSKNNL